MTLFNFLWNNSLMMRGASAAAAAVLVCSATIANGGQAPRPPAPRGTPASQPAPAVAPSAQAYELFLRARAMRDGAGDNNTDIPGAIAAYQRAMTLDPTAADIPADLADLYLDEGRAQEAVT